tara:strand:+ start:116 stop:319 length:204 start_codon:yes stop_codon:yes gene_type:complete
MNKIVHIEAKNASEEEINVIKIALDSILPELLFDHNQLTDNEKLNGWRFSGRWWLSENSGSWTPGAW